MDVLSVEDINVILKTYHDSALAGRSFEKTKNSIRRYYSWPTMNEDIKRYVRNCEICRKSYSFSYADNFYSKLSFSEGICRSCHCS